MHPKSNRRPDRSNRLLNGAVALWLSLSLVACSSTGNRPGGAASSAGSTQSNAQQDSGPFKLPGWFIPICTVGVGFIADRYIEPWVNEQVAKKKIAPDKANQARLGIAVTLGLAGCAGLKLFSDSVFAKLDENDKKEREELLQQAAASGQRKSFNSPRTGVKQTFVPGPVYTDASGAQCRTVENTATYSNDKNDTVVTMCKGADGRMRQQMPISG